MLEDLFGEVIYSYTDEQAVEDGVLIPFTAASEDTRHRITANAFHDLVEHYREKGCEDYSEEQFRQFLLHELAPLVPLAYRRWDQRKILRTSHDFKVLGDSKVGSNSEVGVHPRYGRVLWLVPNEIGGVTMMKPEDY